MSEVCANNKQEAARFDDIWIIDAAYTKNWCADCVECFDLHIYIIYYIIFSQTTFQSKVLHLDKMSSSLLPQLLATFGGLKHH